MRLPVASALVAAAVVLAAPGLALQELGPSSPGRVTAETFRTASRESKLATLIEIQREGPAGMSPGELVALLGVGLDDSEADVRLGTLGTIAMIRVWHAQAQGAPMADVPWSAEEAGLGPLLPRMIDLIRSDPAESVRTEAIVTRGFVDAEFPDGDNIRISRALADVLVERYAAEEDARVRQEIVKSLALSSSDSPRHAAVVFAALSDSDPDVVQYALRGAGRLQLAQALPRIGELLRDPSTSMRLAAATALIQFADGVEPYLPLVQEVAASDPDVTIRRTLEAWLAENGSP